jgi:transcriptional regulator with XRE-family HTH domain
MARIDRRETRLPRESTEPNTLGAFIRKARQDVSMSLRDVEEATNKQVSNGYLSQLEGGRITKPSPHILYALSTVLSVNYEALMQRAGYILPNVRRTEGVKHSRAATFTIDNLTAEEEKELLEYLTFLRGKKK